jgi:hypothetical protein
VSGRRHAGALLALVVVVGGLAGCGKFYWTRPGGTLEEFDRDNAACARETSPNATAASHGDVNFPAYRACLAARGWTRVQHADPPPDAYRGYEPPIMKWN